MNLAIGEKVIYPSQGPCRIAAIVQKTIASNPANYYQLVLLDDSQGELFVPVERANVSGVRRLLKKADIPALFSHFQQPASAAKDWRQRSQENAKRLSTGSADDLAAIIKSLTELSEKKELSFPESQVLVKARRLLVSELAEVLQEPKHAAEARLELALHAHKRVSVTVA